MEFNATAEVAVEDGLGLALGAISCAATAGSMLIWMHWEYRDPTFRLHVPTGVCHPNIHAHAHAHGTGGAK